MEVDLKSERKENTGGLTFPALDFNSQSRKLIFSIQNHDTPTYTLNCDILLQRMANNWQQMLMVKISHS